MPWYTIVGIAASVLGLLTALLAGLRWLHGIIVKAVVEGVKDELVDIKTATMATQAEVNPNSGKSFRDETARRFMALETHLYRQDDRIDGLYELIGGKK